MIRLWTVTIRETMDSGKFGGYSITVLADDVGAAVDKAQEKIDANHEHAHRYEVVGVALANEAEVE